LLTDKPSKNSEAHAPAPLSAPGMARPVARQARAAAASLPQWIKPQLTQLVDQAPDGPDWLHEIKFDGYRIHARLDRSAVRLLTRTGLDWTHKYPPIATAVSSIEAEQAYLDGGDGGYLARRAGLPLTIAAKADKVDRSYYKTRIKPLLKDPLIEFIGEIGDSEKGAFLGAATALLFPIDWPEPFGLVLITSSLTRGWRGRVSKENSPPHAVRTEEPNRRTIVSSGLH
jgi:hypothetical protein